MATGKGVIQGYTGVAAVDGQNQIIVCAQAHGTGSEQELLMPVVAAMKDVLADHSVITAEAGYHSEENLKQLAAMEIEALIADNGMRGRDERFATQERHKQAPDPLHDKSNTGKKAATYQPSDFTHNADAKTCVCPAGKSLFGNGSHCLTNGWVSVRFRGAERNCVPCSHRDRCLRAPEKTRTRQVEFFQGNAATTPESHTDRMKKRIDSPEGRVRYGERFATVEPVFGNLRYNKGLDRFTLRGKAKVDAQCKLFCLVHNIEKLAHHGYAQSRSEVEPPTATPSAPGRRKPSSDSPSHPTRDRAGAISRPRERHNKGVFLQPQRPS